jgi:diazepam-binding inhibitor (GABA receptor modulating acyl-CoA-binding protein)
MSRFGVIFLCAEYQNMEEKFNQAVLMSKELTVKPSNEDLLRLYALFKQSTEGDVTGERPGGFDFKGAAKFNAWSKEKGKPANTTMQEYINLVNELHNKEN